MQVFDLFVECIHVDYTNISTHGMNSETNVQETGGGEGGDARMV